MLDSNAALLACRARLLTTVALITAAEDLVTGTPVTLGATANVSTDVFGYTRNVGSFVAERFGVGMEILPASFPQNAPNVVVSVTPTFLRVKTAIAAVAPAAGRALVLTIPTGRAFDNVGFTPVAGFPWIQEQYVPGGVTRRTVAGGRRGHVDENFLYVVTWFGLAGKGAAAINIPVDVLRTVVFPIGLELTAGENTVTVSGAPGPWAGQIIEQDDGFARKVLTIPCNAHTRI